jgi:hypothetical protein
LWGSERIRGELLKLGIVVYKRPILRYRRRQPGRPPSQTWRTFLVNHAQSLWAADLLTVHTIACKTLYELLFMSHGRRDLVHVGVTAHPTAAWVRRQLIEATPWQRPPPAVQGPRARSDRGRCWADGTTSTPAPREADGVFASYNPGCHRRARGLITPECVAARRARAAQSPRGASGRRHATSVCASSAAGSAGTALSSAASAGAERLIGAPSRRPGRVPSARPATRLEQRLLLEDAQLLLCPDQRQFRSHDLARSARRRPSMIPGSLITVPFFPACLV